MKITNMIARFLPTAEETRPSTGKIVLKTVLITTAVFAFVPTVFKINKGEGFDGYGLLSHVKYEKKPKEDGGVNHNVTVDLIDLQRYGIDELNLGKFVKKNTEENENTEEYENSISIEE